MNKYTAVIIDIASIQEYIFSSNKLKVNVGASHIIEYEIYGQLLSEVLKHSTSQEIDLYKWRKQPQQIEIKNDNSTVEIAYIGGGNALILFKENFTARKFIELYSKKLLVTYPGLKVSFGVDEQFSLDEFKLSRNRISQILAKNKQSFHIQTQVLKSGLAKDCVISSETQEFHEEKLNDYISGSAKAKIDAFERSQKRFNDLIKDTIYNFPQNLEDLSQDDEKSYIAIVHVDGNNMGKKFISCTDLPSLRKLSAEVKCISEQLLMELIEEVKRIVLDQVIQTKSDKEGNLILPFRPIISGGDDFTFITDGKLGIHLAEFLIKKFAEKEFGGEELSACGGVAIVKTKYPFFRAYALSEALTHEAKKLAKSPKHTSDAATLHYLITGGGFVDDEYNKIIQNQFMCNNGQLINGPYFISKGIPSISQLKESIRTVKQTWPSSKLKELRSVLKLSIPEQEYFLATLQARKNILDLPKFEGHPEGKLWSNSKRTPYYDIIELNDFLPTQLL